MNLDSIARIANIIGIAFVIIGAIDPMEGAFIIAPGSVLIALAKWQIGVPTLRKQYILAASLTLLGFCALMALSSMGGFGGSSSLSAWWGLTILPYPAGWLYLITILIIDRIKSRKSENK